MKSKLSQHEELNVSSFAVSSPINSSGFFSMKCSQSLMNFAVTSFEGHSPWLKLTEWHQFYYITTKLQLTLNLCHGWVWKKYNSDSEFTRTLYTVASRILCRLFQYHSGHRNVWYSSNPPANPFSPEEKTTTTKAWGDEGGCKLKMSSVFTESLTFRLFK